MAEISSFPNNSDEYIGAEEVMRWLHGRTKGVYAGDGNAAVTAIQSSMSVRVAPGIGWMTDANGDGICWWFRDAINLAIDAAESTGTLNRIDRVIVEWPTTDYADKPEVKILKGTSSSSATAPALTNNSTTRQISLARISIPAGTTQLTSLNIIDERLDPTVCGIVTETVTADTSMIAQQYAAAVQMLYDAIAQAWAGEISDGSITIAKLAPSTVGELQDGLVPYNKAITLPNAEQKQARDNIGADWVLLWQNANISADFPAQTVSLDLTDYDAVAIIASTNDSAYPPISIIRKGFNGYIATNRTWTQGGAIQQRFYQFVSNGIHFDTSRQLQFGAPSSISYQTGNTWCKPHYIYGIKEGM